MGLDDNMISTFFNSPITLTLVRSSWIIFRLDSWTSALIFWQIDQGITFDNALESTMQICTFLLKTAKVNKKGGTFLRVLTTEVCCFLVAAPETSLSTFVTLFTARSLLSEGSNVVLAETFWGVLGLFSTTLLLFRLLFYCFL